MSATQVMPLETPPAVKAKKPIYKKWWAIALAAVFAIVVVSQATGGGNDPSATAGKPAASVAAPKPAAPKAKAPAQAAPKMTTSQENAVESAENYLALTSFSRKGLIQQLSSSAGDGFTKKQAVYGVDKAGL